MRQRILITGASSGLGRGMAREFAARGHDLALCARRVDRLDALRQELEVESPGVRVAIHPLDVCDHDAVFEVFRTFREQLGGIDRVIVNAGMGKGQPLGTGYFHANRQTAETNFVAALAQLEAALEIFREQNHGHLVAVSSISAMRGMPRNLTTYAATKAGLAALAEGVRVELKDTPIRVTTVFPGFIRSEINEKAGKTPFIVDTDTGCRLLVRAIDQEKETASVPAWPWVPIGWLLRNLPLPLAARLM